MWLAICILYKVLSATCADDLNTAMTADEHSVRGCIAAQAWLTSRSTYFVICCGPRLMNLSATCTMAQQMVIVQHW